MTESHPVWTIYSLQHALAEEASFTTDKPDIRLMDGAEPCLELTMKAFGDLPVFVTVSGQQIIAEAVLWKASDVQDVHALNDEVLRTHKLFPLSTISLDRLPDGSEYYTVFGSLSASSLLSNVVLEIETLAANAIKMADGYRSHLKSQPAA